MSKHHSTTRHAPYMMLAPRCFSRITLVLLSVILALLLFTALRVHNGIPPTVSITAAQSMVENLAGEWFHLDRQHPDKQPPFSPQVDNGVTEQKPPEILEGKASRNLARPPELEYLRQEKFGLTDTILYTQHCIKPQFDKTIDRNIVANISQSFISDKTTISINLHDDTPIIPSPKCSTILPLAVPPPYPKTPHPELIFGVASTYSRLSNPSTLSAFSHWLTGSKSRLILTITDYHSLPPADTIPALVKLYNKYSILTTALPPPQPPPNTKNYTTEQLHFLLLASMLSFSTPQTTFLSLLDDDTFFPSLHTLSAALARFNPSLPLYLGAKSDSKQANERYGEMAFGGRGGGAAGERGTGKGKWVAGERDRGGGAAGERGTGKEKWATGQRDRGGGAAGERGTGKEKWATGKRDRGGGAAGERGTGKEKWEAGEKDRGGGAAGERGTGANTNGKWTPEQNRGGGGKGGRGGGDVTPRDLQHLPSRIWIVIVRFFDRGNHPVGGSVIGGQKMETKPKCGNSHDGDATHGRATGRQRTRKRPSSSELVRRSRGAEPRSSAPPLLSLHHWRSWFHAPVDKMAGVNEVCGDCFLQRWKTGFGEGNSPSNDGDANKDKRKGLWVNGYSYTEYSPGSFPTEEDLNKVEGTWLYADEGDYDEAYGPLRQKMGDDEKKQWLLADAYWAQGKGRRGQKKEYRQIYVYRASRVLPGQEKENRRAVDEVLEIVWEL
ncbi:hypothetical protein B0T21DRAFT_426048 [Apiosordaria backusii]|uniref:Glycosyltransferase family 31 protein n=1 Tax=Apiosordaria backusii TaxID=314023 RepID=A0AA40AIT3_9PEZI|nr:hypothetical protein B0T21DRAFT_426048 [Apiosordaria backusii]